jgi:arylsulfatase A-like enzyme
VPALAYWPGRLKPGEVKATLSYLDWFPTLAALAGGKVPAAVEGRNVWPILTGQKKGSPARLYWNTGAARGLLEGDRKLMVPRRGTAQLYHLGDDPVEKKDLAATRKDEVERLTKLLREEEKGDR